MAEIHLATPNRLFKQTEPALHVASEKLHEAMLILSDAQREAEGSR
jgi:hypothetical protein